MKQFKGNHNIEAAFANFIEVVEQETGLKITDVDTYIHRPEVEQVEIALDVEDREIYDDYIKVLPDTLIWGLAKLSLTVFPKNEHKDMLIIVKPEDDEAFSKCDICEEDFPEDEKHDHFDEPTCLSCAGDQIAEWEAEDQERNSNFYKDVL
jgi:hypothetical protein